MKKLIGIAAIALAMAASAFAQEGISFSAWNNMLYVIGNDADGEVVSSFHQPWGKDGARYGSLNIVGNSEHAGFQVEIHFENWGDMNGNSFGQLYAWIKPIEQIQIIFGKTDQNYLRSDNIYKLFDYDRLGQIGALNEGVTFDEFEAQGILIVANPIDSLTLVAGYNVDLGGGLKKITEQIGHSGKFGAAYTIENIGTVKAGIWAQERGYNADGEEKNAVKVGAAFDLTAIDGVFITVGGKIPLGGTYVEPYDGAGFRINSPVEVNAGVGLYLVENLGIQVNFGSKINAPKFGGNTTYKKDGQFGFLVQAGADYTFAEAWKVFAGVAYASDVYNTFMGKDAWTIKDSLGFGVGIEKSWSNGSLGIAFEGVTNDGHSHWIDTDNGSEFNWCVPIRMNVSF